MIDEMDKEDVKDLESDWKQHPASAACIVVLLQIVKDIYGMDKFIHYLENS